MCQLHADYNMQNNIKILNKNKWNKTRLLNCYKKHIKLEPLVMHQIKMVQKYVACKNDNIKEVLLPG